MEFIPSQLLGQRVTRNVPDPNSGDVIAREGRKFNKAIVRQLEQARVSEIPIGPEDVAGRISAHDVVDSTTGEVLVQCNDELTPEAIERLQLHRVRKIEVLFTEDQPGRGPFRLTRAQDELNTHAE